VKKKRKLIRKPAAKDDTPLAVKPFNFLGCDLEEQSNGQNWAGQCPFCESSKFFVNPEKGLYDCKVCGVEGNHVTFMTDLVKMLREEAGGAPLTELAKDRGTVKINGAVFEHKLPMKSLAAMRVAFDSREGDVLIPCISRKSTVRSIRRYRRGQMRAIAGIDLYLGGLHLLKRDTKRVWLCEGEWDALWMHTLLQKCGRKYDSAVWIPGANTLKDAWVVELSGYEVIGCYDNDEPGKRGAERLRKKGNGIISSLRFLNWPDGLPNGYDVRDHIVSGLARGDDPNKLLRDMDRLLSVATKGEAENTPEDSGEIATLAEVLSAFDRSVLMDDQMRDALKVMLAVALSNDVEGDPLWLYIVGPPGAGKTLLLSALQGSNRCKFVSTVSAHSLVSGWQASGAGDPSLIPKLKGKTLVAKDWTEILSMPGPMQEEIFSTLRGAYDGFVQKPFGNGIVREYKGCFFSVLAGVTHAIHGNGKASLGERFLKFQLDVKKEKANDVVMAAIANVGKERKIEEQLQEVTRRFLKRKVRKLPALPDSFAQRIVALVRIIAIMRAQVERDYRGDKLQYRPIPESGTRLAKQLAKLARLMAIVDGVKMPGEKQWPVIEKVAYSTAYGFHLDIVATIMENGGSAPRKILSEQTGIPLSTMLMKLEDLMLLKAVIKIDSSAANKGKGRPAALYAVTDQVAKLWKKARGETCQKRRKLRR